jgi:hypothetical protein
MLDVCLVLNAKGVLMFELVIRDYVCKLALPHSSSYQHVYRWKRIVRQRQAADSDNLSLNMLPQADQKLLASVGITTADAFLNMNPTTMMRGDLLK